MYTLDTHTHTHTHSDALHHHREEIEIEKDEHGPEFPGASQQLTERRERGTKRAISIVEALFIQRAALILYSLISHHRISMDSLTLYARMHVDRFLVQKCLGKPSNM